MENTKLNTEELIKNAVKKLKKSFYLLQKKKKKFKF